MLKKFITFSLKSTFCVLTLYIIINEKMILVKFSSVMQDDV